MPNTTHPQLNATAVAQLAHTPIDPALHTADLLDPFLGIFDSQVAAILASVAEIPMSHGLVGYATLTLEAKTHGGETCPACGHSVSRSRGFLADIAAHSDNRYAANDAAYITATADGFTLHVDVDEASVATALKALELVGLLAVNHAQHAQLGAVTFALGFKRPL